MQDPKQWQENLPPEIKKEALPPLLSRKLDSIFIEIDEIFWFIVRYFNEVFKGPVEGKEIARQCYEVGYKALPLITVTSFITGIVFTKQSRPTLEEFGAASWLPALVSIAIVRALGPLITALICAGKVGSQIGAELGSMKVTEQIDAMEVSGSKPFRYLVVTRVTAMTIMLPVLVAYADTIALFGGFLSVNANEMTSMQLYFNQVFDAVNFLDVTSSFLKSLFFGMTIGLVGCYKGFHSTKGTEGVGKAANTAVVVSMFLIFILELIALQITNLFRYS
jgi:phospholipid/cholesterol/gamma-HCH transport system permease protein